MGATQDLSEFQKRSEIWATLQRHGTSLFLYIHIFEKKIVEYKNHSTFSVNFLAFYIQFSQSISSIYHNKDHFNHQKCHKILETSADFFLILKMNIWL